MKPTQFKRTKKLKKDDSVQVCASCGKHFIESSYEILCRCIMKHLPACSLSCNEKLGQVK